MTPESSKRLIVVSNRLPYALEKGTGDKWKLKPGSGGLVTALLPVLRNRGGLWIGWPGVYDEVPHMQEVFAQAAQGAGYALHPVTLSREEVDKYYHGYSNESIWPLFHDLQDRCQFDPDYWHTYVKVNRKFAQVLNDNSREEDFVWIHDYQLMDVGHHLRDMNRQVEMAFYLHIPFPSPDIFMKLPERQAVLSALLAYDLVGFQTLRDRRNFLQCVRMLVQGARVKSERNLGLVRFEGREMRVGNFPIGIDAAGFSTKAASAEVTERAAEFRETYFDGKIVLGVDRLDYTKGIPERLRGFANLLERFPEVRGKIRLFQIVVPSRVDIPTYDDLKTEIETLVGEINGRYSEMGWMPIHYFFRSVPSTDLLALYRAADIALITPLKDGMNLVAKEFCACSLEEDSSLILSQFAGAAAQLGRWSLIVNPYDVEQTADALYHAFRMPMGERRYRMKQLRRNVRNQNVFWWVDKFMQAAIHKELRDFPPLEEYIPEHHEHLYPSEF